MTARARPLPIPPRLLRTTFACGALLALAACSKAPTGPIPIEVTRVAPRTHRKVLEGATRANRVLDLSEILIAQEDYRGAQRSALNGLELAEEAGDIFTMSWALYRLGITIIELGDAELGVRIAGAADAARERSGGRLPPPFIPIAGPLDRARAVLGDAASGHYEAGRELALLTAMAMARDAID